MNKRSRTLGRTSLLRMRSRLFFHRLTRILQSICIAGFVFSLVVGIYYFSLPQSAPVGEVLPSVVAQSRPSAATSNCPQPAGVPSDNPIQTDYSNPTYAWTDSIRWRCVYNIQDFSGATVDAQFQKARDAAAANGGGVVYFPAGTYQFQDDLYLRDGVVIRGETPAMRQAKSEGYAPLTKFVFPEYQPRLSGDGTPNQTAFKKILTTSPNSDRNLGIVNIDVNRAAIYFLADIERAQNRNIVVFGVRSNNVAEPEAGVPDRSFQPGWLRYSDRFSANIKITAYENVLVANNRLNDAITDNYEQPGYRIKPLRGEQIITYDRGDRVPFNYANHYGIVVNRSGKFGWAETPQTQPGLFRQGIAILDNWVYHEMRVAIHAAGQGLLIKDNQIRDRRNKQWWTDPTGLREPRGAVTYENRAIDWSGWDVRVEGNQYEVYRHQVMDTKYWSVDGEGILIQECCGGTSIQGAIVRQNQGNSYIGFYKTPVMDNVTIADNQLRANVTDTPLIYVNADTNNHPSPMSNVIIENNQIDDSILARASAGGTGNRIRNNRGGGGGSIEYSCHVNLSANTGFALKPCLPGK
ncbi:MAG: glycoside hydrolase family 55 protein [Cyanobacteria bacterium FC1]|nr:glycoside hydrolase family 55 protein [Desertifilum sp. FACHB-1129]MDA0212886.1 glycoside hydrolase family 55 protein [Cyanobacteria bacterium FC1]